MFTWDDIQQGVLEGQVGQRGALDVFPGASIDSRTLRKGEVFFAIRGKRDGHAFVSDAVAAGAAGVVADILPSELPEEISAIRVPDTLGALQSLAKHVRCRRHLNVVAVTGSVGKTTTKEMVAHVLSAAYQTAKSERSFNNQYGVPLSLLNVGERVTHVVLEMGTNHPGELRHLVAIAPPDIAVITNVGYAHIEHFGSLQGTLAAKAEILEGLGEGGTAILNCDDQLVDSLRQRVAHRLHRVRTVGCRPGRDVYTQGLQSTIAGTSGILVHAREKACFQIPVLGEHFAYAAVIAAAVGLEVGIPLGVAAQQMRTVTLPEGRLRPEEVAGEGLILDDTYNASPDAVVAALRALRITERSVRCAVLGEMKEIGGATEECHRLVGREAAACATHLVAVGESGATVVVEEAIRCGMYPGRVWRVASATDAIAIVRRIGTGSDDKAVLVKGSRFTHTERVILGLQGKRIACRLATCPKYVHCRDCPELQIEQDER